MTNFSQFNIKITAKGFEGQKIRMINLLNREITVHHYKLEPSKIYNKGTCKCLQLQISLNDEKRVLFTSASGLIEAIQQIPENGFPFTTTIVNDNDRYLFT